MSEQTRRTFYDVEIHKCPICGGILGSFSTHCPSCGYELRGMESASSVVALEENLRAIELKRGILPEYDIAEREISTIENFSIPNTKEDILEFIILAASKIDLKDKTASVNPIMKAWKKKFEQAYYKARICFGDSADFRKVERIYKEELRKPKITKIVKLASIIGGIVIACILTVVGIVSAVNNHREEEALLDLTTVKMGFDSESLAEKNYQDVKTIFEELGFNNIEIQGVEDSDLDGYTKTEEIVSVTINGEEDFSKGERFAFDSKIIIRYHIESTICVQVSSEDLKGKNYADVVSLFETKGFTNVTTKVLDDLVTGWITEDGEVESVSINGITEFDSYDRFEPTAKIVITYHTF